MLSVHSLGNLKSEANAAKAVTSYFTEVYPDYYVKGLDEDYSGEWGGGAVNRLNLPKEVTKEILTMALAGAVNDMKVRNAGKENRQMGWDLTFSAPKSVSVTWAFANKETRIKIEQAHKEAVDRALKYLESKTVTRRGQGGHIKESADLIYAKFFHVTSRKMDPQIHTHTVFPNLSIRHDGSIGTIESKQFYDNKMAAGALYRAHFAYLLKELGFEVEQSDKGTFRLKTITKEAELNFSKRSVEIERLVEELGINHYAGKEAAVLLTRPVKRYATYKELMEEWKQDAKEANLSIQIDQKSRAIKQKFIDHKFMFEQIKLKLTKSKSTFMEKDILNQIAREYMGHASIDDIYIIYNVFIDHSSIVQLGTNKRGYGIYTTKEVQAVEKNILSLTEKLSKREFTAVDPSEVIEKSQVKLNPEQKAAIRTACDDAMIAIIQGRAGTGKTTMLKAVKESYDKQHIPVFGISLTGNAAQTLQKETGIESTTVFSFLECDNKYSKVKPNSVLVIDEAGMGGSRQFNEILKRAYKSNLKVIAVGDERQLQPIEIGGALYMMDRFLLKNHSKGHCRMFDVIRQEGWLKETVKLAASGATKQALLNMDKNGCLSIHKEPKSARVELISEYLKDNIQAQKEALILTNTNYDARIINKEVREELKEKGMIGKEEVDFKTNKGKLQFATGDRVVFTKNEYQKLDVRNGQRGLIEQVNSRTNTVCVQLDTGEKKTFNPNKYNSLAYGWAVNTYKAQGASVKRAYMYGYAEDPMASREATYVQISRAELKTKIHVVSGEPKKELGDEEKASRISPEEREKVIKAMVKAWSRNAMKMTSIEISKDLYSHRVYPEYLELQKDIEEAFKVEKDLSRQLGISQEYGRKREVFQELERG